MKLETMRSGICSLLRRNPCLAVVTLACLFAFSPKSARAGNIFDDDWTPPKPVVQSHAAPVQPPAVPVTPAPATTPAAPSPTPQPTPKPQPVPAPPARHGIPGKLEQARSRGLLKAAFAAQLKDRTAAGRRKLTQVLLDEVPKTADNPSDEYVLLGGAIDASKDAGALDLCCQAADTMASQYEVDGLSIKIDAALKMNLRGDSPATAAQNVQAALGLIDPLLAAEDFSTAARILTAARRAAANEPALASAVQKQLQIVESLRTAHDHVAASTEKLKTSPDDPAANLAVGTYLCFSRGDWENGLILLTRGSDANLKQLAKLEHSRPQTADDIIRLADGWWDVAAKHPDPIRAAIHQHAAFFYKLALQGETGLRKTLLEHRIAEAAAGQTVSIESGSLLPRRGPTIYVNSIGMKFVRIEPGTFMMGSPPDEAGHQENETLHQVKITRPFLMATTPVTQTQWKAVMGKNPSLNKGDNHPIENTSWNDAVAFCEKLSAKDRKHYRLPTEAEWEYACRAGTQSPYSFGEGSLDDFAWYNGNCGGATHDVATKKPNPWGLYDMHGDVWQWCSDGYGPYSGGAVDPKGAKDTTSRVNRGGSFSNPAPHSRAAYRKWNAPGGWDGRIGFRVCVDL